VWVTWYQESFAGENPLFIPETDGNTGAYHVFWAFGQYDGMGFSPFAIDEYSLARPGMKSIEPADLPLARSYATLAQLAPVILENQGKGKMAGVVVGAGETPQKIALGNYVMEASYPRRFRAPAVAAAATPPLAFAGVSLEAAEPEERSGALFISLGRMSTWWPAADRCRSGFLRTRRGPDGWHPFHRGRHLCGRAMGSGTQAERGRERRWGRTCAWAATRAATA